MPRNLNRQGGGGIPGGEATREERAGGTEAQEGRRGGAERDLRAEERAQKVRGRAPQGEAQEEKVEGEEEAVAAVPHPKVAEEVEAPAELPSDATAGAVALRS